MRVTDLQEEAVLARDLYVENRMLMKKGCALTGRIITLLKNRNIQFVHIVQEQEPQSQSELETIGHAQSDEQTSDIFHTPIVQKEPVTNYFHALGDLSTETRYGHALKDAEDIQFVRDLFKGYMHNVRYRQYLMELRDRDLYTYMHAIDVFTLSTLFAKRQGIGNLEALALGFLFHDIGKLKTPIEILKKRGKLTKPEFEIMKEHSQYGYEMLCELGLHDIAHLAKSHHERINGTGYPEGLNAEQLPKEVRILQLVDIYSAITLSRSYKEEVKAADAIALLYQDKHLLDEDLLGQFIDFIGVYPENSVVLLSDGTHAIVEKVNVMYPLLPTVKLFETGASFEMPFDFQLTIKKILSYNVETPDQLFVKFSDYLINCDAYMMEKYYNRLKEHYRTFEWFTHIYIPVYQIFNVLKTQKVIDEVRLREVSTKLSALLMKTMLQLRYFNKKKQTVLLLVDDKNVNPTSVQLLEGLFHTEEIYPFVLSDTIGEQELLHKIECCDVSAVYMIGGDYEPLVGQQRKLEMHHLTENQLQSMLYSLAGARPRHISFLDQLDKYKSASKLLVNM